MVALAVIACLVWFVKDTRADSTYLTITNNGTTISVPGNKEALNELSTHINNTSYSSYTVTFTDDIDASGLDYVGPINKPNAVITINGGKHVIKNLVSTGNSCLIASAAPGSSVNNLGLIDCSIIKPNGAAHNENYGLLWATLNGGKISNCFAKGDMTVYKSAGAYNVVSVGGLVGSMTGNTAGIRNCFTIINIDTNATRTGGLVGYYGSDCVAGTSANDDNIFGVSQSYSTGYIYNNNVFYDSTAGSFNYVGGLIGLGENSNQVVDYNSCYTTAVITNPSAGNVKSVGNNADGMLNNIKYDINVSVQRQLESAGAQTDYGKTVGNFSGLNGFTGNSGYTYPVLSAFFISAPADPWVAAEQISYLSAACVYANGTNSTDYYPKLGTTAALYIGSSTNKIDYWSVVGGADEYYFTPTVTDPEVADISAHSGNIDLAASGLNSYMYTSEGDVVFTAHCGDYTRSFYASVTEKNPYFADGVGTEADPLLISDEKQLNNVRVFTLLGSYYYRVSSDVGLELSHRWRPIVDFRGYFNGDKKKISGLKIITASCENTGADSGTGLFANVLASYSGKTTFINVYLHDISIDVTGRSNVGGIIGKGYQGSTVDYFTDVNTCFVSGEVKDSTPSNTSVSNFGLIAGTDAKVLCCETTGYINEPYATNVGGIIGNYSSGRFVSKCISTAVVYGNNSVGGIVGNAPTSGTASSNLLFAGMVKATATSNIALHPICPVSDALNSDNCYFDKQTCPDYSSDLKGKNTSELVNQSSLSGFTSDDGFVIAAGYYPKINDLNVYVQGQPTAIANASAQATKAYEYKKVRSGVAPVYLYYRVISEGSTSSQESVENGTSKLFNRITGVNANTVTSPLYKKDSTTVEITSGQTFLADTVFTLSYTGGISRYLMLTQTAITGSGNNSGIPETNPHVTVNYKFVVSGLSNNDLAYFNLLGTNYPITIGNGKMVYNGVVDASNRTEFTELAQVQYHIDSTDPSKNYGALEVTSSTVKVTPPEGFKFAVSVAEDQTDANTYNITITASKDDAWGLDRIWWNHSAKANPVSP